MEESEKDSDNLRQVDRSGALPDVRDPNLLQQVKAAGALCDGAAHYDARSGRGQIVVTALQGGLRQEVRRCLKADFQKWRYRVLNSQPVASPIAPLRPSTDPLLRMSAGCK